MSTGSPSRRRFLLGGCAGVATLLAGSRRAAAKRPDRFVVGTSTPAATRAATRAADAVHRVLDFGDIGTAVAGRFTGAALDGLRERPGVRYVEEDGTMHAIGIDASDPEVPWGVDRVDAEKAHAAGATGAGADVAIVDTGIDSDHPDLEANLGAGAAFVSARGPYAEPWDDDNGHGTHCAGIAGAADDGAGVVGTSTRATLHAVKVLDRDGGGYYSDVAAGLEHVADAGWDVASMSLGGPTSRTIEDACQYAYDRGVLLVAAAGNDGSDVENAAPATYSTVMAISATDDADGFPSWSNYGDDVELAAPGVSVYSTYAGGGYRTLSGTSMACPHVSGAGGQLIADGHARDEARQRLADTAEDIGLSSSQQGAGLLDVEAAVAGSVDGAPTVTWVTPTDGDTVSGTVPVRIDASDAEDGTGTLTVEWRVDGGGWQSALYDSGSGYYEADWDTTPLADGGHALDARATDSGDISATATVSVTTDNTDDAPTASWVTPAEGDTVSGTVTLRVDANDDRTADGDLTVEYEIDDDATWRVMTYDAETGYHADSWDTSTVDDGSHTLDVRATDGSGSSGQEVARTVTVSNASSSPTGTIDEANVTEVNSRNPHAEFDVPWSATDADGDLDTVELTLTAPSGGVEDSTTVDVAGGSASGTAGLKAKHAEGTGTTYDVSLVVTDASGNTDDDTVTVSEDGV